MHFSKLYLQKNFVPNYVQDPFGREVVGIEVSLNEGESLDEAREQAQNYIKEYIHKNTVTPQEHIVERYLPEEQLPEIQLEKRLEDMSLKEQIESCTELKVLETYYLIVKNNPALQNVYNIKKKHLVAIDITNAYYTK